MANIIDILIIPTYDLTTLAVVDNSLYISVPASVTLNIDVPGFGLVTDIPFTIETTNIYDSSDLGISTAPATEPLPDGNYCISYMITGQTVASAEKRIMRVDKLQQKFDNAFMHLDMMECDRAIKKQSKIDLMSIYFFIQASIASANACDVVGATKLYIQADKMLDSFISENCGCSGNNYIINFS